MQGNEKVLNLTGKDFTTGCCWIMITSKIIID